MEGKYHSKGVGVKAVSNPELHVTVFLVEISAVTSVLTRAMGKMAELGQ